MSKIVITVPCYNEAGRLSPDKFMALLTDPRVHLLFVNDGSSDRTVDVLHGLRERSPDRIGVLSLPQNQGKGEAVRQGLISSLERGAKVVGYVDADLSTPVDEVLRLVGAIETSGVSAVLGSRVPLLGSKIVRPPIRYYLGRAFAKASSIALQVPVYYTQCGAKLFRATEVFRKAVAKPFDSLWAFDVELLGRLLWTNGGRNGPSVDSIVEVPLRRWANTKGSNLTIGAMVRAGLDLVAIGTHIRKVRRQAGSVLTAPSTISTRCGG